MKNIMIIIGTIILGGIIVTTMILGAGDGTLQKSASDVVAQGNTAVDAITWSPAGGGGA